MKRVEQRRQKVLSMIEQLKREIDNLRQPEYGQSRVNMGAGGDRYLRPRDRTEGGNGKG